MFTLKHVAEDGTEHLFHVDQVQPLGLEELRYCLRRGRRSHATTMWGTLRGDGGEPLGERSKQTFPVEFKNHIPFYGLVDGGVVPPMYVRPESIVILDKNVVAGLARTAASRHQDAAAERWLFEFLDSPSYAFNPVLGALEGSCRRTPTLQELRAEVLDTARAVRERLPSVKIVEFSDDALRALHRWRQSFDVRSQAESRFLAAVAPHLKDKVAASRLQQVESAILEAAKKAGVGRGLALLTVLANLYESPSGSDGGAARAVLKPADPYSAAEAYNALSDLRQLELLGASSGMPQSVALLTADKGLALLWCGLGVQSVSVGADLTSFRLMPDLALFPRLPTERRVSLFAEAIGSPLG